MNNEQQTPPAELFAQVDEINSAAVYDLAEVSTEAEAEHFKEPEPKPEKPQKEKRAKRPANLKPAEAPAAVFGSEDTRTALEQDEADHIINRGEEMDTRTTLTLNEIVPGDTLMTIIDKLMSIGMPLAINAVAGSKLKPKDFKLNGDDKRALKPAVDACAKTIPINFSNPWVALSVTAIAIYGAKVVDRINFEALDNESEYDEPVKRETRGRKPGSKNKGGRDYAAEYARRKGHGNA